MEERIPLAERMRPTCLDDFFGQKHIVGENMLLRRAIKMVELAVVFFMAHRGRVKPLLQTLLPIR